MRLCVFQRHLTQTGQIQTVYCFVRVYICTIVSLFCQSDFTQQLLLQQNNVYNSDFIIQIDITRQMLIWLFRNVGVSYQFSSCD